MNRAYFIVPVLSVCLILANLVENPFYHWNNFEDSELLGRGAQQKDSLSNELDQMFQEAYERGRADESSSINIEVPSRKWLRSKVASVQQPQDSEELTKQEILTQEEAKNDMGGLLRIEAVNSKFAHKIQGLLGSIQSKLDHAGASERDLDMPETPTADQILHGIKPTKDEKWDRLLSQLDSKIISSPSRDSDQGSMEDEARYENAFRKALDPVLRRRSHKNLTPF